MPPLVSVVVPVFNGARFLGECLDSLVAQDYPAVEIVVVDDGSTDDSAELAERYDGVRVLRRPHEGLPATRNAGVAAASGSLIGFCDADDWWTPNKARVQVEHLEAHPDCAVVLCRQETAFAPGVSPPSWLRPDQVRGDLDGVSPTSGLFRGEVLRQVGGFRTSMGIGDFDLLIRIRTAGLEIGLIEEPLRVRRIHDDNMTNRVADLATTEMFQSVREHLRRRT